MGGNISYRRSLEVDLLRGLQKFGPTNLIGALSSIPRNNRLLYLHAYQSMIWNRIVSKRLKTYGTEVLIGDLYRTGNDDDQQINYVTESNRSEIKLEQIVLPLPGYDIKYPSNELHAWYREFLQEDGIKIDQMKYQVKDYSLPGNYRAFIVRPEQTEFRTVTYDQITDDPLQSDYDRLMDRSNRTFSRIASERYYVLCLSLELVPTVHKYLGLVLAFSLPKSCYATMALRELLHRNESKLQTHHHQQEQGEDQSRSALPETTMIDQDEEEIDDVIV